MSEKNEIKRDGGRAQKNSGRGQFMKGDAVLEPFCYDIKEYAQGFTVSRAVWAKICSDAFSANGREPALKVVLGIGDSKTRLWVISDKMFDEMLLAWRDKYDPDDSD